MSDMISRFAGDLATSSVTKLEPGEGDPVLTSCGDLFVFYGKCLVQLGELSTGQPLLDLAGLFKKYLGEYTSKLIMAAQHWRQCDTDQWCPDTAVVHESVVTEGSLWAVPGYHRDSGKLQFHVNPTIDGLFCDKLN